MIVPAPFGHQGTCQLKRRPYGHKGPRPALWLQGVRGLRTGHLPPGVCSLEGRTRCPQVPFISDYRRTVIEPDPIARPPLLNGARCGYRTRPPVFIENDIAPAKVAHADETAGRRNRRVNVQRLIRLRVVADDEVGPDTLAVRPLVLGAAQAGLQPRRPHDAGRGRAAADGRQDDAPGGPGDVRRRAPT